MMTESCLHGVLQEVFGEAPTTISRAPELTSSYLVLDVSAVEYNPSPPVQLRHSSWVVRWKIAKGRCHRLRRNNAGGTKDNQVPPQDANLASKSTSRAHRLVPRHREH